MPKLGDIHPETGLIFWSKFHPWLTKKQFMSYMASKKRAAKKFQERHPERSKFYDGLEASKQRRRLYYLQNTELVKARSKAWAIKNKRRAQDIANKSRRKMMKNNPLFALRCKLGNRIDCALRRSGMTSKKSTIEFLGCDVQTLKKHLESLFTEGMGWHNWTVSGWHVDHKIPLSTAKTVEEMVKLCHYTNLQPLWALDNMKKSNKVAA